VQALLSCTAPQQTRVLDLIEQLERCAVDVCLVLVPGVRSRIIRMDECGPRPAARGAVKKQPACLTYILGLLGREGPGRAEKEQPLARDGSFEILT